MELRLARTIHEWFTAGRISRPSGGLVPGGYLACGGDLPGGERIFRGRDRMDTKRALLRYWSEHRHRLGMDLRQFESCCTQRPDGSIIFHGRR